MNVLLSIKPYFAEKIFSGEKIFEFRKSLPNVPIDKIILYVSMPVQKIIGEIEISGIICDEPGSLWLRTQSGAGITEDFFNAYFDNKPFGYAIRIKSVRKYQRPLDPFLLEDEFTPPMSYRLLSSEGRLAKKLRDM